MYEPRLLREPYQLQVVCIGVIFCLFDLFIIKVAFVRAPLNISALGLGPVYNLRPGGLDWKPFYNELDIVFTNQTDMPYENFNALVRPEVPVAGIAQIGNLPDVSFRDRYGVVGDAFVRNPQTNETTKAVILATDAGYSVSCKEVPAGSSLQLVMETVGIKPLPPPSGSIPQGGQMTVPSYARPQDFSFMQAVPDVAEGKTFHYWMGSSDVTSIFIPNVTPGKVTVRGSYLAGYRPIHLDEEISVKLMQ